MANAWCASEVICPPNENRPCEREGCLKITIDNHDGKGPVDYTPAVTTEGPLTVRRRLNEPSSCTAELWVPPGMEMPARRGRVVVTDESGDVLFTGYLPTEPAKLYAGTGTRGPVYRLRLSALSDEWLLNNARGDGSGGGSLALARESTDAVTQLTQNAQGGSAGDLRVLSGGGSARALGAFAVSPSADWSTNAAAAANATYAALRVLDGSVTVQPAGEVTHTFGDADGSLELGQLSLGYARELANDVTVSGATEPAAYVQEHFQGDGTTSVFPLRHAPFREGGRNLVEDSFDGPELNRARWTIADSGEDLALTSAGLTVSGGSGTEGQLMLTANTAVEMAGAVIAELQGVLLHAGSDGMLAAFYAGAPLLSDCLAGFRVRQSASATGGANLLIPVVNGSEVGQSFAPIEGHSYTLRLRTYCVEMQRVPQRFYCMVDGAVEAFGSPEAVRAPMHFVFEVRDEGVSSNTPATVLYDSEAAETPVQETPSSCSFLAMNATRMYGSIASVAVTRPGSVWVVSTATDGSKQTRLSGAVESGADLQVSYAGEQSRVTFFPGRIPSAGERVTVFYRSGRRSVARLADADSIAAESAAGASASVPGVSRWLGRVLAPPARTSADCAAAAKAILAIATARSAALHGTYKVVNPEADLWPGDVLQMRSDSAPMSALIREVVLEDGHSAPETVHYSVAFANDWATQWEDGLGLRLSDAIADDAVLPETAANADAEWAESLQQLAALEVTGEMLQLDTGREPPAGGGFEVRRRDWAFGAGVDASDLVLRSPVRSFSLPRLANGERLFVRMYDGSTPPLYSRFSAEIVVNWPVQLS